MREIIRDIPIALYQALPPWPPVIALMIGAALVFSSAKEDLGFTIDVSPSPAPLPPKVETPKTTPYAPAPGRDDRTPLVYLSKVFDLEDADLPQKLSGVGPVFWFGGRGSGALISRKLVLTTAHLFVKGGNWVGGNRAVPVPPAASNGSIYLPVCGRSYEFSAIEVVSDAPRSRLGLDYAIAVLDEPACEEAAVLPVSLTPDDLGGEDEDAAILNMGSYPFKDVDRFATHPIFTARKNRNDGMHRHAVFGVVCRVTGYRSTGDVPEGSTGVVLTNGCDGVPGGSGGPLLMRRADSGDLTIIGVANSYRPTDREFNNYTQIEGAFAAHLSRHVALEAEAGATAQPVSRPDEDALIGEGDWRGMREGGR